MTDQFKKWKPTPDEKETFKAKFVLQAIFVPQDIPEKDWTRLVSLVTERDAINVVTWAGYKLMERVAEFLVGVKFEKWGDGGHPTNNMFPFSSLDDEDELNSILSTKFGQHFPLFPH